MQTLTWSLLHLPPRRAAAGAPGSRAAAYWRGVGPRSLSCAPQDLGHRGVTVSSLLRWPGPWFCAQLAGSVAASAAPRGQLDWRAGESLELRSSWGRPGKRFGWVKRPVHQRGRGGAAEHIWLGPASRTTREASTLCSHP